MAMDLEPFKAVMNQTIVKILLLGGIIIVVTLLFKKLEKWIKKK